MLRPLVGMLAVASVLSVVTNAGAVARSPAYAGDFPDPFVLPVAGTAWAYSTGSGTRNLQVMRSSDLVHWSEPADPLPVLPRWAEPGFSWAPGVLARGPLLIMYYTARAVRLGRQCISVATSLTPAGPFSDVSTAPLVCQLDHGGSIDPFPLVGPDGTAYLLWKSDDNAVGGAPVLWAQRLAADGLSLLGQRVALLRQSQSWEGGVIEGPSMVAAQGRYYLFYGANRWNSASASMGYAVCRSPLGPCADASAAGPWMSTHGAVVGPSGPSVFLDAGTVKIAYHAWWPHEPAGGRGGVRALWIDSLRFSGSGPVLG